VNGHPRGYTVRQFIPITTIAILFTATACAPERIEVSCPRPDEIGQIATGVRFYSHRTQGGDSGIYFVKVPPDSFWACAGIEEGDSITEFNSLPLLKQHEFFEMLALIMQDDLLEFSVLDPSGDRRLIVVR
jgi:S1-C subfamily serine protease